MSLRTAPLLALTGEAGKRKKSLTARISGARLLFCLGVALPTFAAIVYYGFIASDRYVSETEYVVRGINARRPSGLDMLFQSLGISRSADDAYAIHSYLLSRDAVRALEKRLPLQDYFSRRDADWFSRFPYFWTDRSFESLYSYYLDHVSVIHHASKGVTVIRIAAFSPADAQAIAAALLSLGETRVNEMNERARDDAVRDAEMEVEKSQKHLIDAQAGLTAFRNTEMLISPDANAISTLETITALSTELAETTATADEAKRNSPLAPAAETTQSRIKALTDRIGQERLKIAGSNTALASKVANYEELTMHRQLAEKSFAGAVASLESARQEARRQQIYVEEVVTPNLPDSSTEPERLRMVATVFFMAFAVTSVLWLLITGSKEHISE